MEIINRFELVTQGSSDKLLSSNLVLDGEPINCLINGEILDAQYQCSLGFLLISNEDSPFEEGLHITLLSPGLEVLDALEISHAYASGSIQNLRIIGESSLQFAFFGKDNWQLTIFAIPQRWSLDQLTPGIANRWRRLLCKGHLSLRRLDS